VTASRPAYVLRRDAGTRSQFPPSLLGRTQTASQSRPPWDAIAPQFSNRPVSRRFQTARERSRPALRIPPQRWTAPTSREVAGLPFVQLAAAVSADRHGFHADPPPAHWPPCGDRSVQTINRLICRDKEHMFPHEDGEVAETPALSENFRSNSTGVHGSSQHWSSQGWRTRSASSPGVNRRRKQRHLAGRACSSFGHCGVDLKQTAEPPLEPERRDLLLRLPDPSSVCLTNLDRERSARCPGYACSIVFS
jgi:hypothetical protein